MKQKIIYATVGAVLILLLRNRVPAAVTNAIPAL